MKYADKVYYYEDGLSRRKQIADWVVEQIGNENKSFALQQIKILLQSPDNKDFLQGYLLFDSLVMGLNDETLVYLIYHNRQKYGNRVILTDLIRLIFGVIRKPDSVRHAYQKLEKEQKEEVQSTLKEVEKKETKYVYGINSKGERVKAIPTAVHYKGKTYVRFKDEQGKFIKREKSV